MRNALPGLATAVAVAVAGTLIGRLVPGLGAPVASIVLGTLVGVVVKPGPRLSPGISFAGKQVLKTAVVILGAQLSLAQVVRVGAGSVPVIVGSLLACLIAAYAIGKWLGVSGDLRTLIGAGTGICGASAIAAVTPVIGAASAEVAYAISTIFLFNVAAVLTFPTLGHLLGMSDNAFGLFAGTAVNDMSSVVAAATTYSHAAADYAVVVKLTRTLMIVPICLGLAALIARRGRSTQHKWVRVGALVPTFLVFFVVAAAANTLGLVPTVAHHPLTQASVFLITVSLSAIGLSTDVAALRRAGPRPLVLGACLWAVVSLSSIGLQMISGPL